MDLRICFEPHDKMEIDNGSVFKYYGNNYLADFDAEFGGHIAMDAKEKIHGRFEPVWQFIMFDVTDAVAADLMEYIKINPMNGYHVHVYKKDSGVNSVKLNVNNTYYKYI